MFQLDVRDDWRLVTSIGDAAFINASAWPRDDWRSVTVLVIMLSKNAPAWRP